MLMPGINFIYDFTETLPLRGPAVLEALDFVTLDSSYERKVLWKERRYFGGIAKYREYPVDIWEDDELGLYLEGRIYDQQHAAFFSTLRRLAGQLFAFHAEGRERLASWLREVDGEFVVLILHKLYHHVAIFNDVLGRLPLYYHRKGRLLIVARDLRFMRIALGDIPFDGQAMTQHLLFGYPLGKRTLLEGVHRLGPARLITIDAHQEAIAIEKLEDFNFEIKAGGDRREETVDTLVTLFIEGCRRRAGLHADNNIVSLSGGLDSRAVAAALSSGNVRWVGATFLDADKAAQREVEVARHLAAILHSEWNLFSLPYPKGRDLLTLLRLKSGLNCLGMSFLLLFLSQVKAFYGPGERRLFTGDGGDKVLWDLRPAKPVKDLPSLVNYVLSRNKIFSLDEVAALTRIPAKEIRAAIAEHVLSYPERDWKQKYVHFLILERAFKWLFEGEDRNRCYLWSVAPFYATPFFRYAMHCPDTLKSRCALYRDFLVALSPQAAAVPNVNWRLAITSKRYRIKSYLTPFLFRVLPLRKRDLARLIYRGTPLGRQETRQYYKPGNPFMDCFQRQITRCKALPEYLSSAALADMTTSNRYSKRKMETVFTLTSLIEDATQQSSIERYYDADFL
ncbi:MAG: hypothetical protein D6736_08365 [Nitrospinota bacterium]|nr:MAG: hypothetical protein D6736_08365 [Nitrospinota bacterium]